MGLYDDPLTVYLRKLRAIPALTRDEEIELFQHVLAGDQESESASKRLIEANLALVVSISENYGDRGVHMLDLIQEGNDALLRALKTFSGQPAGSFSAHAATCIDAAIVKALAGPRVSKGTPAHEL